MSAKITEKSPAICNFEPAKQEAYTATKHGACEQSSKFLLTPRELEVLKLVCEGHASVQIAKALGISVKTVATFRQRIITKTKARTPIAQLLWAIQHRVIPPLTIPTLEGRGAALTPAGGVAAGGGS